MVGEFTLNQLGIKAAASSIWETQAGLSMNLDEKDVLIIISNSGASKLLLDIMEEAKIKNVTMIAITNNDQSPIAKSSDFHITTATREKLLMEEYCFSRISAMTVVELLFLFLAEDHNAISSIRKHEELIAGNKV